ncbi:alpha/beta fold hydrolase [Loktanella sp. Alg231-35]|uniref:alpha/beta fold hydrolase n=1 Tax=Loktanella sp. Alg231-35 TaxID=1922220 RepID=UPI000D5605D9|nr:alpha/beta fold hydrolase [Loktanella sp. Alg231-35]
MWWWSAVTLAVLALAVWPFRAERQKPDVTVEHRFRAEGEFAHLSQGITFYRWFGPARGPVAVVVHGLNAPSEGMHALAESLGELGYRVLVYDLYGRGLSDAPKGLQDRAFFLRQLTDLCHVHDLREDITIVGYSMGGSIATAFAIANPYIIKRVILLASAGVRTRESRFSGFCRRVPFLGDWLHLLFGAARIGRRIPQDGVTREMDRIHRAQRKQLARRGFLPALLSSRRGMLSETQEQEHRQLGRKAIPVIAIWAQNDSVIPLRAIGLLAEWNRKARQEMIEDADHDLPYTHSKELTEALRETLRD